jgi:hypothetical protein
LTEAQLAQALAAQGRDGGRLGTVLVEHGMVDLEALTVYLGLELGIPIATGAMLERAKRAAVRLLQPQAAFKHKCVPLVVQDRQLIAAIEDPHDFATLEALTQLTGYRVLPRVAPELRIYYYVERYYGVARPARFMKFGDSPRGTESQGDAGLPAPPLPGLPPVPHAPVAAPGPRPQLKIKGTRMTSVSGTGFDESALELDAEDLLETLDNDIAEPAEPQPQATVPWRFRQPAVSGERLTSCYWWDVTNLGRALCCALLIGCGNKADKPAPAPVAGEPARVGTDQPPPVTQPDFPEGTHSLEVTRTVPVRLEPGDDSKRIGTVAIDTRVGWIRTAKAKGCAKPWIEIRPRGWICGEVAKPSKLQPFGREVPILERGEIVPGIYGRITTPGQLIYALQKPEPKK